MRSLNYNATSLLRRNLPHSRANSRGKLMEEPKSAKNARKYDRKQRKCQHVLQKETGVTCSPTPTKNLGICNAGLSNGLTETTLIENFSLYGTIEHLAMIPGKSCCFISYKDPTEAIAACENTDGKLNLAQNNKPLYLAYVETLPQSLCHDTYTGKPPGLIILENFITEEEELTLLTLTSFDSACSTMKHRKVHHYGYEFNYLTNNVDKNAPLPTPIPQKCDFLWPRLAEACPTISNFTPNQLTVNHYLPGQGIPPHVDTHSAFEDPITSLSLGSSAAMEFRHKDGRSFSVFLPRRSMLVMTGESRYDWTHGITPRKLDVVPTGGGLTVRERGVRVSFTFRAVRRGACTCGFRSMCDSQEGVGLGEVAERLEGLHVHEVYERVARHFSETRSKLWPNVREFVEALGVGAVLVDVGCGNGKYLKQNKGVFDVGCDRSFSLVDICRDRGFEVMTCNCLSLPLKDEFADAVISIAVIHHLSTEVRRLQAVTEIVRILRVNGVALIYVWAKDQARNNEKSSYLKQDRRNRKKDVSSQIEAKSVNVGADVNLPVHVNRNQFQHQDVLVPWKLKQGNESDPKSSFLRFYHVFEEGELENLCAQLGNVEICNSYYDQGNWCVLIKKLK